MSTQIAHICQRYLGLTETFIYAFLAHARRFKPFVVTDIARNETAFPIPCSYLIREQEAGALGQKAVLESFLGQLNYPNCFENTLRERDTRLLHAHFGYTGLIALELKRRLNIPLVTTFYGYDASRHLLVPKYLQAFQRLFWEGDLFLVLGKDMARRLRAVGCPKEKIRQIHLGVDLHRFPFRQRRRPRGRQKIKLLYCGRLVEKKGVLDALIAFAGLAQKWDNLVFRIVGDGPLRQTVSNAVCRLGLEDRVVLKGAVSHVRAIQEMQDAHLFVLPSRTARNGDMEGTPTVLIEAQALGMPVVSTHHADIPEVVSDGRSGFLVREGDCRALADRLDHLLSHPETWSVLGKSGRAHVEHHYNIHSQVHTLENVYDELLP